MLPTAMAMPRPCLAMALRHLSTSSSCPRQRVVVLGSGWGGFRVAKDLDKAKFDVTVVSPRNHFLFTPLLPSTTVGTLEFRCVQEPVSCFPTDGMEVVTVCDNTEGVTTVECSYTKTIGTQYSTVRGLKNIV